jgi:flagellin
MRQGCYIINKHKEEQEKIEEICMGLRINTNVQSLAAQRSLGVVKRSQDSNFQKLSSGSRINKSADDAAGLAISEQLKAEIRGAGQALRNSNDGISMVQIAEGGLNEVSNIMIRLRELSVQAASDTIGDVERGFSNQEFQNLTQEVERIAASTTYNGTHLLNGESDKLEIQVGIHNIESQDRIVFDPTKLDASADKLGVTGLNVSTKGDAQENLNKLDASISMINGNRANLGALQNRLQSTIANLEIFGENMSAANSRIRDTDVALETAELAKNSILNQAAVSVLGQANNSSAGALRLLS